mmetsp:Transcript_25561/g.38052  ORF Transcript_25561/g.38052 Transcript_25561/m.38052 type:complete len:211 (+) Transcript_25561:720-1352(+)
MHRNLTSEARITIGTDTMFTFSGNNIFCQTCWEWTAPDKLIIILEALSAYSTYALHFALGFILVIMLFQELTMSTKSIGRAIAFKVMPPVTFNVSICYFQARPTISAKHFSIASLSSIMLTKVSSKSDAYVPSCLAAITRVFKATCVSINALLETFSSIETYRCERISRIALFISAAAVDAAPTIIAVNTVLAVDVQLFKPWNVRTDSGC